MGENTNQIEQEIRERRADLGRNLDELEDKARQLADWRTHYRNHPGWFVGAAFGLGVVLGLSAIPSTNSSTGRTRRPVEPDLSHDPYRAREAWSNGEGTTARAVRHVSDTWGQIADALLRTASAKAVQLVGEFVPGFNDNLDQRDSHSGPVH